MWILMTVQVKMKKIMNYMKIRQKMKMVRVSDKNVPKECLLVFLKCSFEKRSVSMQPKKHSNCWF